MLDRQNIQYKVDMEDKRDLRNFIFRLIDQILPVFFVLLVAEGNVHKTVMIMLTQLLLINQGLSLGVRYICNRFDINSIIRFNSRRKGICKCFCSNSLIRRKKKIEDIKNGYKYMYDTESITNIKEVKML